METRVQVRWNDEDAYGHVNNAVYLTYAEHGRDRMIDALVGATVSGTTVLARVAIDYRAASTHLDEEVVVTSEVVAVGRTSLRTVDRVVRPDGVVAAELQAVVVVRDRSTGKARPWTDAERAILEAAVSEH